MDKKIGVRRRRKQRIREIKQSEKLPTPPIRNQSGGGNGFGSGSYHDLRSHDPEYVWNKKLQREWGSSSSRHNRYKSFFNRILVSAVIYIFIWMMFQLHDPWALQGRKDVQMTLSHSFNYSALDTLYRRYFHGSPAWLPVFGGKQSNTAKVDAGYTLSFTAPVKGTIIQGFDREHHHILIKTAANAHVKAAEQGEVIQVQLVPNAGFSVIVKHANGYSTIYGHLQKIQVAAHDWVQKGEDIGIDQRTGKGDGLFDFAVTRNESYVDPAKVVAFD